MPQLHHTKLRPEERDDIARLTASSTGIREIARQLGRSPSTISEELHRNQYGGQYVAIKAQTRAASRKSTAGKRHPLKNEQLYAYVLEKLRGGWSPEQIAGRLGKDYPDDSSMRLHHEVIYRYIYAPENKAKLLWEYLPRKQTKRKQQHGRGVHKSHIPDRVSIHDRPAEIETRTTFGHWEGDIVEGQRSKHDGIHTEVERKTRKLAALKVGRIASRETTDAQLTIFSGLPVGARRSTTLDNGREHHLHMELTTQLGLLVYFADPYSSWQRGMNENTNGLLRRYLPKRTDFTTVSQEDLDDIVEEINNRPRKCLQWQTPNEIFREELAKCSD